MKEYEDKYFDLAIVDPPYGVDYNEVKHPDRPTKKWSNPNSIVYKDFSDIKPPTKEYFDKLFRVSKNQIIWGANNFEGLPVSGGWIVWDKKVDPKERLSMAELASKSFIPSRQSIFPNLFIYLNERLYRTYLHLSGLF